MNPVAHIIVVIFGVALAIYFLRQRRLVAALCVLSLLAAGMIIVLSIDLIKCKLNHSTAIQRPVDKLPVIDLSPKLDKV